jgi:DNA-binding transcriptional LysR family regulator
MDVRALRHFTAIIRHRNFRQAAAALGLTQPALSQSVRRLEAELSVRLLERGRFGAVPTPIGEVFAAHAALILSDFERAHSEVDALRGARAGSVVIGTGPSEATRLLPLALGKLLARSPNISVSVTYGMNEQLMPAVRRGEIEFALSSISRIRQDDELRHEPIWHDRACIIARSGHPLTRKRKMRLADLLGFSWIQGRRQEYERRAVDELFLAAGLPVPRMAIETTSITLIKAMVAETDYLTFAPRQSIYYEERAGSLTALSIGSGFWKRTVGITYRHNARLTPASRALIAELKAVGARLAREAAGDQRTGNR